MALCRGLELAKNLGITRLLVQLDNKACVQTTKDPEVAQGECVHLIEHCKNLVMEQQWEVRSLMYIGKETVRRIG